MMPSSPHCEKTRNSASRSVLALSVCLASIRPSASWRYTARDSIESMRRRRDRRDFRTRTAKIRSRQGLADRHGRVAGDHGVRRDVAGDSRTSPDDRALADPDAFQYRGVEPDPDIVFDLDFAGGYVFDKAGAAKLDQFAEMTVPLRRRERVSIVVMNVHAMREENAVAKPDMRQRPDARSFADIAVIADLDAPPVRINQQLPGKP